MAQITIDLPAEVHARLQTRAAAAGYASSQEYVRHLIVVGNEMEEQANPGSPEHLTFRSDSELEKFLLQRLASDDMGEMTVATFDSIRERLGKTTANRQGF